MPLRIEQIDTGGEVGVQPVASQFMRQETVVQANGVDGDVRIIGVERAERGRGGTPGRERGFEPLHPAALLVDEDQGVFIIHGGAQIVGKRPHLVAAADVAAEQREAPGPCLAEEGPLLAAEADAHAADDAGAVGQRTKQSFPPALRVEQKAVASAREAKPVTAVR